MSKRLICDGCEEAISKEDHMAVEVTNFGPERVPIVQFGDTYHFHGPACLRKLKWSDRVKPTA